MTADCEEDENKKYGVAPNLDAVHTRGYAKRSLVLEDCSNWPVFHAQIRGAVRITMGFLLFL